MTGFFWYNEYQDLVARLSRIELSLKILMRGQAKSDLKEDHIMSALTDLKDAISALGDSVTSAVAEIEALLAKIVAPGTSDADVAAAVAQIKTLTQSISDEVAKAQAASP